MSMTTHYVNDTVKILKNGLPQNFPLYGNSMIKDYEVITLLYINPHQHGMWLLQ